MTLDNLDLTILMDLVERPNHREREKRAVV
jgi:hypothetical protein